MPKIPRKNKPAIRPTGKSEPFHSWVDYSVLDEMASRLRNAGLWDNNLGDGIASLKQRIETLERFSRYDRWNYREIRRPLVTWNDCRKLLVVISSSRLSSFSNIAAPVEACLQLAVLLYRWERDKRPVPRDIRGMMHGAICVEWKGATLIVDGNGMTGEVPSV